MSDRTFIVLGEAEQLIQELRAAFPQSRVIQTTCLDRLPAPRALSEARVLIGPGTVRPCCIRQLEHWTAEDHTVVLGERCLFKPGPSPGSDKRSFGEAWSNRADLLAACGRSSTVDAFITIARAHDHEWFTVEEAARSLGCSVRNLRRLVELEIGYSPHVLLHLARIDSVARAIVRSSASLTAIAKDHHFPDLPTMTHQFKRFVGESPKEYRQRRCAEDGRNKQRRLAETDN